MIESILEKAKNREKLSRNELIQLFEIDDEENLKRYVKFNQDANTVALLQRLLQSDIMMHSINPMRKYARQLNALRNQAFLE